MARFRPATSLTLPMALLAVSLAPACAQESASDAAGETAEAAGAASPSSASADYRVVTVAEGLENPWGIAFVGDDILVTEKAGDLRVIRDGQLLEAPISGVPEVLPAGQGGLMDVVPHPDFDTNRWVYLTLSKPMAEGATTAVVRGRYDGTALTEVEELFVARSSGRNGHYGSRIAFDGQGYMFVSVGDRQASPSGDLTAHPAQDLSNHHGVIVRLHDDGRVPDDNPFVGRDGALPEIWSYGHRNPQALAFEPATGHLWSTEHGPQGGDEFNRIEPGLNYGWPVVGFGVNYGGDPIHDDTSAPGMESPEHYWVPSIATSGLAFYTGDRFPEWQGNAFAGGLAGEQIARLTVVNGEVTSEETILEGMGRVRDVREGPDGYLYVALDDRAGRPTSIVRLEPGN